MAAEKVELKIGQKAPDFTLLDMENKPAHLSDFRGKWAVLYFYPKDNTSGCTLEAIHFTQALAGFQEMNAVILGISPDSVASHCGFSQKHALLVKLLSDEKHEALAAYGVWQLKKLYGRESWGVVRSTFLIDPEGIIAHIWRKVKVPGHVEAVKAKLAELQAKG